MRPAPPVAVSPAWGRAQTTLEAIGDSIITVDRRGRIEYLNPAALTLLDLKNPPIGEPLHDWLHLIDEEHHAEIRLVGDTSAALQAVERTRALLLRPSGHEIPVKYSLSDLHSAVGDVDGRVVLLHDISAERRVQQQLSLKARHDPLTGLVNRHEFEERLERLVQGLAHGQALHALLFMDLDRFKRVNDACGHAAGDELLRQLSTLLMTRIRGRDTLARLGGDEFALILEHCPPEEAQQVAEKLREAVQHFRFAWHEQVFSVGVSIGLVSIAPGACEPVGLLAAADHACYEAKNGGRNRVFVARDHGRRAAACQDDGIRAEALRAALETGTQMRLQGQPIHDLQGDPGGWLGVELLLRLDLDGVPVPAASLLASAERFGMARQLDRYVVDQAFGFLAGRPGWCVPLFVNLSEDSVRDACFAGFVQSRLERQPDAAALICFEISETTLANCLAQSAHLVKALTEAGCRFAIDQAGTGASALYALHGLALSFLKLNGALLGGTRSDPYYPAVCRALCDVAGTLGIRTVACPVTDGQVLAGARALGIRGGQGFFLDPPAELAELVERVSATPVSGNPGG